METEKKKLDMLHGPIWNRLPRFAFPVAATAILEQLFNASDVAVVGNFTGANRTVAVAAVGANSPLIGLIVNLFIGIALGTKLRSLPTIFSIPFLRPAPPLWGRILGRGSCAGAGRPWLCAWRKGPLH